MSHLSHTDHRLPSTATDDKAIASHEPKHQSLRPYPSGTFIHILDDGSLLDIFDLCRPAILDENETITRILQGGEWTRERWWYKLAQVCQRWRYLMLASPQHLRLSLVCTRGTPVAEMRGHSPLFPLIIDHVDHCESITTRDEEGIILAFKHRDRVRRIRLDIPVPSLQKIIMALEDEFPIMEFLCIGPGTNLNTSLMLPKSLRAPHLRHLRLSNFAFPIGTPLLTTSANLAILSLDMISLSAYFPPNDLIQLMPQLETLGIAFRSPVPNRDVKRELLRRPPMTHVTLPNLRWFWFHGSSAYLEALLSCMTAPRLATFQVTFFNQLTFPLPHLSMFLSAAENMRFSSADLTFSSDTVSMSVYSFKGARLYGLFTNVGCRHLDWQVSSAAQYFNVLKTALSTVEVLILEYWRDNMSSEWRNEADRTQWRDLLRSFSNLKTLRMGPRLVDQLSHSLQSDDGESPVELLPELKEITHSSLPLPDTATFTPFIDARRIAGRPVTLVRRSTRPSW